MASEGDLQLVIPSLFSSSDGDPEGGQISTSKTAVSAVKDAFFFPLTSLPSGQGSTIRYRKAFFYNAAATSLTAAKLWILSQEHSPQIKVARERNSGGVVILDGSDYVLAPTSVPANLSDGLFSLAADSNNALSIGTLTSLQAAGVWFRIAIPENLAADTSVPMTVRLRANG